MRKLGLVLVLLVALSLVVAGCGGGAPTSPTAPGSPAASPPAGTQAPAATGLPSELADLLRSISGLQTVQYDMIVTSGGMVSTTHVWIKAPNQWRADITAEGQTLTTIGDLGTKTMYSCTSFDKVCYQTSIPPGQEQPTSMAEEIAQYQPQVVGTDTIDGKECLVIQYTTEGLTNKAWIWKQHAFPVLRLETTGGSQGLAVMVSENIDFGPISDSVFQPPYKPGELPGMPPEAGGMPGLPGAGSMPPLPSPGN